MRVDARFWSGRRVLLTGHTGFKGGWLTLWLRARGAEVTGVALPPITKPSLFEQARIAEGGDSQYCDLRDADALRRIVHAARPEVVLHLAAQALVRPGYRDPLGTFGVNVMGTANLLDALRGAPGLRVVVAVTTDKVYRNREWHYPYRECDELGGHDPYSASKAASELVIACYRDAFLSSQGVAVASARAGNVIGGGDWSEDRILPDAYRAWSSQGVLEVRHPEAIRPWQHVLEPLAGYLALAERLWEAPQLAGPYNFGPPTHEAVPVRRIVEFARAAYGRGEVMFGSATGPHEAGRLALETSLARETLGVRPRWSVEEAVRRTMNWFRDWEQGTDARALCEREIAEYEAAR